MKIYVGHSTDMEYEEKLYSPLKESGIPEKQDLVLPHDSDEFFNSRKFLKENCNLFVAEVSKASTGLGIELGWAEEFGVPVVCVYREGSRPSNSLQAVTDRVFEYGTSDELIEIIEESIEEDI